MSNEYDEVELLRAEIRGEYATKGELREVRDTAHAGALALAEVQVQLKNINLRLEELNGHLTWFVRVVIGVIAAALLAVILK